jgi:hypothetical protein
MTTNFIKKQIQEVYRVDHHLPVDKMQILKAEGEIDRGLLVKLLEDGSYEVAYWYNKPEIYPIEIEIDGKSMKKDAKKIVFKFHPELEKLIKEGGGNGGGGFGDGGGTVAVSSDSGFFTPTYGSRGKRKKRTKKTGIDKLADFVTNNSPERKSMEKSEVVDFIAWVEKEYKNRATVFSSGETINPQIPRIDYKKRWGSNEYDSLAAGGSKDKEAQEVPALDEETEEVPFK